MAATSTRHSIFTMNIQSTADAPNLWQKALDALDPTTKTSLNGIISDYKGDVLTEVLEEAEKKKRLCLKKRWKVEIRGKTIILRDLFDKIIAWANQFRAIVDVAVQIDPTGASLPWAGVRFLLHVAVSDRDCFESTVSGLETVSLLIARYAAFESLYLQRGSLIETELERALTDLYTHILTFLAHGIRYFGQPTPIRMVKSIFQSSQNAEVDRITKADEEVLKFALMVDSQTHRQTSAQVNDIRGIVETLQSPVWRLVDESAIYAKTVEQGRFVDILQWLSSVPYTQHHTRQSEGRLPSSSEWIFHHPEYIAWKSTSSSSILLLHGIPGSGKTYLTASVIDAFLAEHSLNTRSAPIAYFYCGDSRFGKKWADPVELMRTLVRQFAVVDKTKLRIHEAVSLEYERREAEAKLDGFDIPKLQCDECANLILGILGANPAVIIADGIDEIEEYRRHEFFDAINRIRDESASVVKVFLSSRDDSNIFAALPDAMTVHVQEVDTRPDMELYVRHCVSTAVSTRNLLNGCVPDGLQQQVISFLLDKAGEMFLWVNLQMERLCKLKSARSVLEAIHDPVQVAGAVDYLYTDILESIRQADPNAYQTAVRAFSWMVCMQEPLSSDAIIEAVSTGPQEPGTCGLSLSELLAVCSNLIVLDHQLDTLRFAHVSFKEYLEAKPEFQGSACHDVAASGCLETCINGLPIDIDEALPPAKSYALYAVIYWAHHLVASTLLHSDGGKERLNDLVFGDDGLMFEFWLESAHEVSQNLPNNHPLKKDLNAVMSDPRTPFFTACVYGLKEIFNESLQHSGFDINAQNLMGHTGLYLAAACSRHEIVNLILDHGGDIGVSGGKYGDALSAATANGHTSIVKLLSDRRNLHDMSSVVEPALRMSFLRGHEDIARLLLSKYLDVSKTPCGQDDSWVFEAAAQAGFMGAMDDLAKGSSDFTAEKISRIVKAAIRKGHINVVRRYMEKDSFPSDAIAIAALFGKTDIVSLCLDNGHNVEKEGPFGTPLRCASLMGHESTVRALLARGADVNASTALGDALQAAAMKGNLSITNILIDHGANHDNTGGFFGNALQAAAYRGHRDVAEALLNAGAPIKGRWCGERHGRYKDAFHAAAEAGQEGIIDLFLSKDYSFPEEREPLLQHMERRPDPHRDLLRQRSPTRNECASEKSEDVLDNDVDTLAPAASLFDFGDILRGAGAEVDSQSDMPPPVYQVRRSRPPANGQDIEDECYALEATAARGYLKTVKRILARREQLGIQVFHLGQALWAASKSGHAGVAQVILSTDSDLRSFIPGSLERAARYGHLDVIEEMLQYEESFPPSKVPRDVAYVQWSHADYDDDFYHRKLDSLATASEMEDLRKLAIEEAVRFDRIRIVEHFLGEASSPSPEFLTSLMKIAATHGSKSSMALLLARDGTKNALTEDWDVCFRDAVIGGHKDVVQYLIDMGTGRCNPETLETACVHVASTGDLGLLRLLAPEIQGLSSYIPTLTQSLHAAIVKGQRDTVEWLVRAGADVNAIVGNIPEFETRDNSCRRSRHRSYGHSGRSKPRNLTALQACLQILEDRQNSYEAILADEPSFGGLCTRQEPVMYLLLENDADPNAFPGCSKTPLHIAANYCSEQAVRALISHGADVNFQTREGGTPLACAVNREIATRSVVNALLDAGAIISIQEAEQGYSPILDKALKHFGPRGWRDKYGFRQLESVEQVLSDGPGGAIKLLLTSQPLLRATDARFGLLFQMIAATGDLDFMQLLIERGVDVNVCGHYYGCALQAAARYGHLECLQLLLDAGAQVNLVEGRYHTPLQAAIVGDHEPVIKELIARGADTNLFLKDASDERFQRSPLRLSVQSRNLIITKLLLDSGADPREGPPVLHLAVENDDFEATSMLLDAGSDVNSCDSYHSSALVTACGRGNVKIITLLIERGADVKADGTKKSRYSDETIKLDEASALHAACANGHYDVSRMLLQRGADPEQNVGNTGTPLKIAASMGHLDIVRLLLEAGGKAYSLSDAPDVLLSAVRGERPWETTELLVKELENTPAFTPACEEILQEAFEIGGEDLFLFLIRKVPQSLRGLALACRFGSKKAVEIITSHGIGIDSDLGIGGRALHVAAYHQQESLVNFLIARGADVHTSSSRYGGPVSAVLEGLLGVTERDGSSLYRLLPGERWPKLTKRGQNLHSDADTEESIDSLIFMNHLEKRPLFPDEVASGERIIKLLLRAGAEVNLTPRQLGTPLHVAACLGEVSIVSLLLGHGADINATGGYFGSALLAAMTEGRQDVFNLLLSNGIDVNICSREFGSALHYACGYKDRRTVQTLLEHGADVNLNWDGVGSPLAATLSRVVGPGPRSRRGDREAEEKLEEVLEVLLQYRNSLRVTSADLVLAAETPFYFFRSSEEEVVSAVASIGRSGAEGLKMLLERAKGVEVNAEILKSVKDWRTLQVLLECQPRCEITSEILEVLARNNPGLLEHVLDHEPQLRPTSTVIEHFLQLSDRYGFRGDMPVKTLKTMLDRAPEIDITDTMLMATRNAKQLKFLLSRYLHHPVSDAVLESVVSGSDWDDKSSLLETFFQHDPSLKPGQALLHACLEYRDSDCLECLFKQDPDLVVTSDHVPSLIRDFRRSWKGDSRTRSVVEVLVRYGKKLEFTSQSRKDIEDLFQLESDREFKERFLSLRIND
ncbi:hypothetical protein AbraIFM66951_011816 [Aspergillus brasiliensis]|nr:hypothetical protein AbraIFM66951_011816 [Aspergillus brasiliensis]